MAASVPVSTIKSSIKAALSETFDEPVGMYLDRGDALWQTLENVTAAQASVPIAPGGNSIASQIKHMSYYIDGLLVVMRNEPLEKPDWEEAWKTVEVDEDQWQQLKQELRESQSELLNLIDNAPEEGFANPDVLTGSYVLVAHNAFHLGQIRHALAAQGQ